MRTNAWVTVERDRALSWKAWVDWSLADPETRGDEPPLSAWEKNAARKLHDADYLFKGFLRPTIATKVWVMLSVYDVTEAQLAAGYAQLGDAATGGDFGVAGAWRWFPGQSFCQWWDLYAWRGNQVLQFMPPTYDPEGTPIPAVGVRDVNVLFGQPPREFPV